MVASVIGLAVATAVGLAVLWPSAPGRELPPDTRLPTDTETAGVDRVIEKPCAGNPASTCRTIEFTLRNGPEKGRVTSFELEAPPPLDPEIDAGDSIRVAALGDVSGVERSYVFADFDRRPPMIWLALAFAALVILFGRLRGAMSLAGLVASLAVRLDAGHARVHAVATVDSFGRERFTHRPTPARRSRATARAIHREVRRIAGSWPEAGSQKPLK